MSVPYNVISGDCTVQPVAAQPMTESEIADRIRIIRDLVEDDPERSGALLAVVGTGLLPARPVSLHAPTVLALLDELELLVALLAEHRDRAAQELHECDARRRARDAYAGRRSAP